MIDRWAKRTADIGYRMTMMVTAPILGVGAAAVKSFADFDLAMTKSVSIMEGVTPQIRGELEEVARQLSLELPIAAEKSAQAYFYLASAGMTAQQAMASLPQVAKFAIAGAFDLAKATELLAGVQAGLGLSSEDVATHLKNLTRVSDVLVKANTLSQATTQEFAEALSGKAAGSLRLMNKELEEGVAILAVYAKQNIKSSLAGTWLAMMLRDLHTASQKNADVWERLGIRIYDSEGAVLNMADIVGQLETKMEGMSVQQKKTMLSVMGFTDRSRHAIETLIGFSDELRKFERQLKGAGGTTEKVANEQLEAFWNQIILAWNAVKDLGIEIGAMLAPSIVKMAESLKEAVKWFKELDSSTQSWMLGLAGVAAAVGPVLVVLSTMVRSITILIPAIKLLYGALSVLISYGVALVVAWAPVIGIMAGIAAAVAGIIWLIVGTDGMIEAWEGAKIMMKEFIDESMGLSDIEVPEVDQEALAEEAEAIVNPEGVEVTNPELDALAEEMEAIAGELDGLVSVPMVDNEKLLEKFDIMTDEMVSELKPGMNYGFGLHELEDFVEEMDRIANEGKQDPVQFRNDGRDFVATEAGTVEGYRQMHATKLETVAVKQLSTLEQIRDNTRKDEEDEPLPAGLAM